MQDRMASQCVDGEVTCCDVTSGAVGDARRGRRHVTRWFTLASKCRRSRVALRAIPRRKTRSIMPCINNTKTGCRRCGWAGVKPPIGRVTGDYRRRYGIQRHANPLVVLLVAGFASYTGSTGVNHDSGWQRCTEQCAAISWRNGRNGPCHTRRRPCVTDFTTHIERYVVTDALRAITGCNHHFCRRYALKRNRRAAMTGGATCSDAAVAKQTSGKTCVASGRRSGGMAHRAVGTTVRHVNGRSNGRRHDAETSRRNCVLSCIGRAVALRAIGRCRRRAILMNQCIRRVHREVFIGRANVGVACRA